MLTFFVLCNAYIRCCYAAEISALVATLDAATLQRSLFTSLGKLCKHHRDER